MNVEQFKEFQDGLFAINQKTWGILNDLETRHKARAKKKLERLADQIETLFYYGRYSIRDEDFWRIN